MEGADSMTTDHAQWRNEKGFTLLELMIAGIIAVGIVAAGFTILTSTEKATATTGQVVETQQNVRIAIDMLSRDIKQAGFGMRQAVGNCPTAIVPGDETPAGADRGPDRISLVVPIGNPVGIVAGNPLGLAAVPPWTLQTPAFPGFNSLTLNSVQAVADMNAEAGGNLVGSFITLAGAETVQVTGSGGTSINVNRGNPSAQFGANTPVYLLRCITYQVIPPPDLFGLCDGRFPCLVRGVAPNAALNCNVANSPCLSIADEIEDIQFAYACDGCVVGVNGGVPNEIIDDQTGSVAGYDALDFVTNAWNVAPMLPSTIKMVQVAVVGRQRTADQGVGEANVQTNRSSQVLQVLDHNHAAGVFAAGDFAALNPAYNSVRHRMFTRIIEVRNQGS
jgi:type IV pilus assembly protein PilW